MKTFAILGAGVDSVAIIARVKSMGYHVTVVDHDPNAPGFFYANNRVLASCYDPFAVLDATDGLDIVGVLCGAVDAPLSQAAVAAKYSLVGPSSITAARSQDKEVQHDLFLRYGIRVPEQFGPLVVGDPSEMVYRAASGPNDYVVLKPADSRGARGVFRIQPGRIPRTWVVDYYRRSQEYSPTGRVLVQRWVAGTQLSTESIVQNGKILFTAFAARNYSRLREFAPYVIEDGSTTPWDPHFDGCGPTPEDRVVAELQQCVDALELKHGTLKGDVVYDGTVTIVEVATRLSGGGFCSTIIPAAYGYDFVGTAANIATGNHLFVRRPVSRTHLTYVCQRYHFPTHPTKHPDRGAYVLGFGKSRLEAEAIANANLL